MRLGVACGKCEWRDGEGNRIWMRRVERRMKFTRSKGRLKQRVRDDQETRIARIGTNQTAERQPQMDTDEQRPPDQKVVRREDWEVRGCKG